jgi:hypothetical protein
MGSTVFVEKPRGDSFRVTNPTGVALVVAEFTVIGGRGLVAMEAIGIAEEGALEDAHGKVIQAGDFDSGEAAFASANLAVYWDPSTKKFSNTATVGHYLVGYTLGAIASGILRFIGLVPILIPSDYATLDAALTAEIATRLAVHTLAGRLFRKTVTLTSVAAGTAVHIVTDAQVDVAEKVFVTDFLLSVNGATAWTDSTGTVVTLQDTAAVVAATFAKAQLTGNAQLGKHSTGVTLGTPMRTGVGLTADKGIDVIADSNFDAGSDITITVCGFIAAA